jgi:peptidoglycan/xylan/chitin deacetylase (PgdA/CDA1 family)
MKKNMFMMANQNNPKAQFVISIDTELAWGSIYDEKILKRKHESFLKTRACIKKILLLFEKYHISATWAIVGHLMLENCSKDNGIKHPDLLRPNYSWFDKDWFDSDPCGRDGENSIWYGDDIINMIKDCKVQQEIGSHSFSHIMFGDKGCSSACAESDIKKWIEVAELHDIKPGSFVFPFNSEGHHEILGQYGFKIYRSKNSESLAKIKNKKIKRIAHILNRFFALEPSTSKVETGVNNLLKIQGDFCYFRYKGWRNFLMWKSAVRKSKKGINRAINNGEAFHFWFHPFEIAANLNESINDLDEIFSYASKKINDGLIENMTMNQLYL